jgi:hypothetical protein
MFRQDSRMFKEELSYDEDEYQEMEVVKSKSISQSFPLAASMDRAMPRVRVSQLFEFCFLFLATSFGI